jgi:hypothetical protein
VRRSGSELQVAVNDGTATVTGTVRSLWLKIRVGSIVSQIAGVRDFANDVEVIPESLESHVQAIERHHRTVVAHLAMLRTAVEAAM